MYYVLCAATIGGKGLNIYILNKLGVFLNQQFKLFQMPPFPSL